MQYREVFNFMAVVIRKIIDNVDEQFYVKIGAMSWKKSLKLKEEMEIYVPELFSESDFYEALLEGDLLQRLWNYYNMTSESGNYDALLTVIEKLEVLLKEQIEDYALLNENQEMDKRSCLNDNVDECNLQLVPKFFCKWSHNNREKNTTKTVNSFLKHCFYIPAEVLRGYKVKHVFLSRRFENATDRGSLRVAITPLCNTAELLLDLYEKDGTYYFAIEGVSKVDEIKECVLNQLELAKEGDADILLYPEMLGSEEILGTVMGQLQAFSEDEKDYPELIICPTVWNDNKNVCYVLDKYGTTVVKQEKQHAFPMTKNDTTFIEGIEPDNLIYLVHCQGIGRIVVLICKDALQREYLHMVLEWLKATLVIIPSFSTGYYDFKELMQMCRTYDCCGIWINTCSANESENADSEKTDPKGFILRTGKQGAELENEFFEFRECVQKKGLECKNCLYMEELLF